jgi:hypothetical protein
LLFLSRLFIKSINYNTLYIKAINEITTSRKVNWLKSVHANKDYVMRVSLSNKLFYIINNIKIKLKAKRTETAHKLGIKINIRILKHNI